METPLRAEPPMELPMELKYVQYEHGLEAQYLPAIRALISKDLSEPYSIYVYRYFLYQWGHLCYMVSPVSISRPPGPS
jgi:peptide alpha-N-acetyltransferase